MDYKKGLKDILKVPLTPEEIRSEELDQFYKDNIEGKTYTPEKLPGLSYMDFPEVNLSTPVKEPSNKFGDTAAMKDEAIDDELTKPKEQYSMDSFYEDKINDIQKKGKSWLVKHLNKQDELAEVKRLQTQVEDHDRNRKRNERNSVSKILTKEGNRK